jgi:4-hydroxythreonine-4-phosphate dehydrogenase
LPNINARQKPIIGISVGDPNGIGPEITAKALALEEIYKICCPLVVSDFNLMKEAIQIADVSVNLNRAQNPREGKYAFGTIDVLDMNNVDMSKHIFKKATAAGGKASFEYIKKVIALALVKEIDATVTGPINKEAINLAGYHYAGHTEIYADFTKTKDYAMMLADGNYRVVHVSTHVSLRKACDLAKKERILKVIHLGYEALLKLGVDNPRIAVAGLNPHAGEDGLFGDEEMTEIIPAIEVAKAKGINIDGPVPPDTVFAKARGGQYDLVVAMYHDQGHIAMKVAGFNYDEKTQQWTAMSGVNLTLGLPIIRTSVDHGVAFGKAGEGRANPESMIQAIKMAEQLCE